MCAIACLRLIVCIVYIGLYGLTSLYMSVSSHYRKVVEYGLHVKELKVEIYLIELCLCQEGDSPEKAVTKAFSRSTTVGG